MEVLHDTACPVCLSDDDGFDGLKIDTEQLLWDVYHDNLEDGVHKITARAVAQKLWEAIEKGYGKSPVDIEWDSPDWKMLANLNWDTYKFSTAKNFQTCRALTWLAGDPEVKGYGSYRARASEILERFNENWLRTEYNHAIAQAQAASRWVDIQARKEALPLLEYQTIGDGRVRDAHAQLDGVIKPVDDVFWQTYYPPNGWNCRCEAVSLARGEVTKEEYTGEGVSKDFAHNYAAEGRAFPIDHSYYNGIPKETLNILSDFTLKQLEPILIKKFPNGGELWASKLVKKDETDYKSKLTKAHHWASGGDKVYIMPRFNSTQNDPRYKYVFKGIPEKYYGKCPDFLRNNDYWELEGYEDPFDLIKSVKNMINRGGKQAFNVVITYPKNLSIRKLKKRVKWYFMNNKNSPVNKIEYIKKGSRN